MYGREVRVPLQLAKEVNSYLFQWQNTFQTCMTGYTVWLKAKVKGKYKELHYRKATSRRLNQVTEDDPYCIPRTEELLDKMLQSAGLTLRTDKCTLGTVSCEFQGHVAGSGRVVPGKDKTEASRELPLMNHFHLLMH